LVYFRPEDTRKILRGGDMIKVLVFHSTPT